ncbi:hypothetical protein T492DRAFT_838312 [Pavlovales sp. CCMP2436]|nr:hypothetical protein T492DRAFT_838312 [Pavlovales sp. CCMP2436]
MADEKPERSSKLHKNVSSELTRMGIAHTNKLCLPRLGYHVDIAISPIATASMPSTAAGGGTLDQPLDEVAARARKAVCVATAEYMGIVIEVDGPSHYDDEWRLRPVSEMIRRHLALAGWAVLTVPYWEWDALKGQARTAYFQELLARTNLSIAPSPSPAQPEVLCRRGIARRQFATRSAGRSAGSPGAAAGNPPYCPERGWRGFAVDTPATGAGARDGAEPRREPSRHGGGEGSSAVPAKRVVALLVERVPGFAAKRGEALCAHLRSRDPFDLCGWSCVARVLVTSWRRKSSSSSPCSPRSWASRVKT